MSRDIFKVGSREHELTLPHQKCDAKQPCTTCVNGDRDAGCTYEQRWRSPHTGANAFSVSHGNAQTPASGFPEPPILPSHPPHPWPNSSRSISSLSPFLAPCERPSPPTARLPWELLPHVRNEIVRLGPSPGVSVVQEIHDAMEYAPRLDTSSFTILPSSFAIHPSIRFQTIPWPLPVSLSLLPLEYAQVSDIAGGDVAMSLYVVFGF